MWNLNSFRSQLKGMIEDEMGALMNRALEEEDGEEDQGGGRHFFSSNFGLKNVP